jgi:hypothetical protein
MPRCYGKKPPKFHPKTLLLRDYLPTPLRTEPPEAKRAWEYSVSDRTWATSMLANGQVGDCVIAAMLHYVMGGTGQRRESGYLHHAAGARSFASRLTHRSRPGRGIGGIVGSP